MWNRVLFFFLIMTNFFTQKKIGIWNMLQAEPGFRAGAMAVMTRFESWSKEEVEVLAAGALSAIKNPKVHAIFDL